MFEITSAICYKIKKKTLSLLGLQGVDALLMDPAATAKAIYNLQDQCAFASISYCELVLTDLDIRAAMTRQTQKYLALTKAETPEDEIEKTIVLKECDETLKLIKYQRVLVIESLENIKKVRAKEFNERPYRERKRGDPIYKRVEQTKPFKNLDLRQPSGVKSEAGL